MLEHLHELKHRVIGFFRRGKLEADMAAEMRLHLELETEANIRNGMSQEDALFAAQRHFGGMDQAKEIARDHRGFGWLQSFSRDLSYGARGLLKSRGYTVVALATLALGIGANTSSFTTLNRLLLRPLPFRDARRLVQVWASTAENPQAGEAPGDYFDFQAQTTVFDGMAAYVAGWGVTANFVDGGQPAIHVGSVPATGNLFRVLGVAPQLGRLFSAEEEQRMENVTLISNAFWRTHYHGDPKVLGQTARINGKEFVVIGVMPPALDDSTLFLTTPGIYPLDPTAVNRELRSMGWYSVVARLKPGVTLEQAQSEMTALAKRLEKEFPKTNAGRGQRVVRYPLSATHPLTARFTWIVMGLSVAVLLIACLNLANLQLVRITRRGREMGIRLALGSSRWQLIRLLVSEALILSFAGGALGLLIAGWVNFYVGRFFGMKMPIDFRVLGFTFVVATITGLAFGTVPAWIASTGYVSAWLKTGAHGSTSDRSRHWLRQSLVIVQLCLSLTLLSAAGFFVKGIYTVSHRDLGWDTDHELIGGMELAYESYGGVKDPRSVQFTDQLREALSALPGVEAVDVSQATPASGFQGDLIQPAGHSFRKSGAEVYSLSTYVSARFFDVYKIGLLRGRAFRESDRLGSPSVAIVNQSLAQKLWPGENPIGKRIENTDPEHPVLSEVVGLMGDFEAGTDLFLYQRSKFKLVRPWAQNSNRFVSFSVRTLGPPEPMKEPVRKALAQLLPDLAQDDLATARESLGRNVLYFSFLRRLLLQISVLGLLLAALGIYGVVANLVSERRKEIGIRMALGADAARLVRQFLKSGLRLASIGAALGLATSLLLLRALDEMIPGLTGNDPNVFACGALLLFAAAVTASWIPARRATRVNLLEILRMD